MIKILSVLFVILMASCSIVQDSFCYFGQCIPSSKLHPNPVDEVVLENSKAKAKSMGIDPIKAIEPVIEDILKRDGNYGLPRNYKYPKHHYHFRVFGDEIDLSKFKKQYPEIVELHSWKKCPQMESDISTFINFSTFNRLYENSYIFGYRGGGVDGYGIIRYDPTHAWKTWPELIESGITTIYD